LLPDDLVVQENSKATRSVIRSSHSQNSIVGDSAYNNVQLGNLLRFYYWIKTTGFAGLESARN